MDTKDQIFTGDQTQFIDQAPVYQDQSTTPIQPEVVQPQVVAPPQKKNKILIMGLVGAVILVMVGVLLMVLSKPKTEEPFEEIVPEEVIEEQVELSPLEKRIKEARADLKNADPTTSSLAFPPVNSSIRLIDQKRR